MIAESAAGGAAITIVRHLHCNPLPLNNGGSPKLLVNAGERGSNDR